MKIVPEFRIFQGARLTGQRIRMSLAADQTFALWSGFMPQRNRIADPAGNELYSVRVYDHAAEYFSDFVPGRLFDKWAAVAVEAGSLIPEGMESLTIPSGLYAVFPYKGPSSAAGPTYRHIYMEWLPGSGYFLDERPHFEIMGEKYRHESPDSEEEIWIPVKENPQNG